MTLRRPQLYRDAKPAATTDQRVTTLERATDGLPPTVDIWSADRSDSGFGDGVEPEWTGVGDGSTTTFPIPGRLTTSRARYRVTVGGLLQAPTAYSLPGDAETLVFVAAPPAGVAVHIVAPFYGT